MNKQTLYHKGKQGELRIWSVWTEGSHIKTEYGVLDGEMQISTKEALPKNIGRSNETSAEEQAELEAKSLYQFKLDRKYSLTQEEAKEPLLLPMLAKDNARKLIFPCYAQPKLDGNRALAYWVDNKIKLISRSGKEWTVPSHINKQLEQLLPDNCMLDGELYIHGKSCQTITSYVKKFREVETPTVEYHVYDAPVILTGDTLSEDSTFEERLKFIQFLDKAGDYDLTRISDWPNIKFVETKIVNSLEELKKYEASLVKQGYEGTIARNMDGLYIYGYRSNDLVKIKTFQDAEFEVLDCRDGIGKFAGCAVFLCKNDKNDLTFECTMATSMQERALLFQERAKYIGKKLTVKFFDRTDDNLPRFPVGKLFRDEKDLDK